MHVVELDPWPSILRSILWIEHKCDSVPNEFHAGVIFGLDAPGRGQDRTQSLAVWQAHLRMRRE